MPNRHLNPPRQLPPPREGLPEHYHPLTAGYAKGPLITAELSETVTPSEWRWRNCRTYVVRFDDHDYRTVRVYSDGQFIGYWAVEFLGVPLD